MRHTGGVPDRFERLGKIPISLYDLGIPTPG